MKKYLLLAIIAFLLNSNVSNGQIYSFNIYTTAPEQYCHGQYTNILYPSTHNLAPGTWRFEWYRLPGSCAGSNYGSVVGIGNDYYVGESGMYTCIAYHDTLGVSVQATNYIIVRVLPSYPYFPYGPMYMPKPQYSGNANCVTSLQLCIPLTGNLSQTQPSVVWYRNNVALSSSTALTYTVTSTGYYKYKILSSCSDGFSDSVLVTVGTSPDLTINPSTNTQICSNTTIPISVSYQAGLTYQWLKNGVSIPGATSNVYTTGAIGTYSCIISGSSCGTVESNSIYLSHKPAPNASFNGLALTYLVTAPAVTLSPAIPGGTFSGPGISGNTFSPAVAGVGTHTITYNITGSNGCQNSYSRNTTVNPCPTPAAPTAISGSVTPCAGATGIVYTCSTVSSAVTYNWTVPANATIVSGLGTTSITVNFSSTFTSGLVSVSATNSCGTTGSIKSMAVYGIPATPGTMSGQNPVCAGTNNVVYSVPVVNGATGYSWIAPPNATIISGQNTNQVTLNYSSTFTSGSLSVRATNVCGVSNIRSAMIRSTPLAPGAITGPNSFCAYQQGVVYSIASVTSATSYSWQVPQGATIVSGQGTTSITVNFGNKNGKVRVQSVNICGVSGFTQLNVVKNCRIAMVDNKTEYAIYPNPSSGDFMVTTSNPEEQLMAIEIYDIAGKIIFQQQVASHEFIIEGAAILPGMYTVVLITPHNREIFKVVKTE